MDRRFLRVADLEVRLYGEAPAAGQRLEFGDVHAATAFLAQRMADGRDAHVLRALAGELGHGAPRADDRDVVAGLAAALVAGRLTLVRPGRAPDPLVGPPAEEQESRHDGDDAFAALQEPPSTHWIEIQLVGDDGCGIPGQRYLIVTSDGLEWRGFTDSLGVARLTRIPAGDCKVSFPDLDAGAGERL